MVMVLAKNSTHSPRRPQPQQTNQRPAPGAPDAAPTAHPSSQNCRTGVRDRDGRALVIVRARAQEDTPGRRRTSRGMKRMMAAVTRQPPPARLLRSAPAPAAGTRQGDAAVRVQGSW